MTPADRSDQAICPLMRANRFALRLTIGRPVKYYAPMPSLLLKYLPLIALLSSLAILTSVVCASADVPGTDTSQCCAGADDRQDPSGEDRCAEHNCRCHFCNTSILNDNPQPYAALHPCCGAQSAQLKMPLSDYIRSIDYPPKKSAGTRNPLFYALTWMASASRSVLPATTDAFIRLANHRQSA